MGTATAARNWTGNRWAEYLVDRLTVALLANGHILLEGVQDLRDTIRKDFGSGDKG